MSRTATGLLALLLSCAALPALAQGALTAKVRAYGNAHRHEIFMEYLKLLALPNIHGDVPALQKNAELLQQMFAKRGLETEVWPSSGGVPVVFAEKKVPGATRTILFYIHYDGQPVEPKRWAQPTPFTPVVRTATIEAGGKEVTDLANATFPDDWRIYARSAGDDKAPIAAMLGALDAIDSKPKINVKIILHGEEEGAGPSLEEAIKQHPDKLKSDLLIILDGPQHSTGNPTIFYGARGGANVDVTVYTAKQSMHNGNYGNWLPDANVRLAQLISSMVAPDGKVVIPGFYSDVLPFKPEVRAMIDAVPDNSRDIQKAFGVGSTDGAASSLQEGLNIPAFSIHQMSGGEPGGVIPASASAQISMRLVSENDAKTMQDRVINFIRAQGYFIVDKDPDVETLASHPRVIKVIARLSKTGASGAWATDPNNPQAAAATQAMRTVWGPKVVRVRTLGAGIPATPFIDAYHVPTVGVSLANYDDNQHSDNENVRVGNIMDGMVTVAGLMMH